MHVHTHTRRRLWLILPRRSTGETTQGKQNGSRWLPAEVVCNSHWMESPVTEGSWGHTHERNYALSCLPIDTYSRLKAQSSFSPTFHPSRCPSPPLRTQSRFGRQSTWPCMGGQTPLARISFPTLRVEGLVAQKGGNLHTEVQPCSCSQLLWNADCPDRNRKLLCSACLYSGLDKQGSDRSGPENSEFWWLNHGKNKPLNSKLSKIMQSVIFLDAIEWNNFSNHLLCRNHPVSLKKISQNGGKRHTGIRDEIMNT